MNRFTGEIQPLTKAQGKLLSEDWERAKVVRNQEGKKVFRFKISSPVTGRDGKVHMGTAIVDLSEVETPIEELEAANGKRQPE